MVVMLSCNLHCLRPDIVLSSARKGLAFRRNLGYSSNNMQTVAMEKAQAALPELLKQVAEGEEFTITQNGQPKAKLSAVASLSHAQARAGSLPGEIWLAPDFDAPLDDFKD